MSKRWVVTLSLAAVLLFGIPALARQAIGLNGEWQATYGDVKSAPPADATWSPVTVPSAFRWRPLGPHTLWYRRDLYLPPAWAGQRIILTIKGAKYSQRVLLNGAEVGQHLGGFESAEYDLTKQAMLGSANELLVAVQDWTSLIASGTKSGPVDPNREFGSWVKDGLIAPLGARGWEVGIWGDVVVDARPRVWIDSVFVAPSVRQQLLRVHVALKNASLSQERTTVTLRISQGGGGPHFAPQVVATAPGELKIVSMEAAWPDACLWSPHDPHLYSIVAGARTESIGDSLDATFGFREFWAEGDRFYLNGTPINLLSTASLPLSEYDSDPAAAYGAAKAGGAVAMALTGQPWPDQWYAAADKSGMLLVSESALWRLAPSYALSRDEFWKNANDHLTAFIKAQRNHPSVVIWAADNELLYSGASAVKGAEKKVAALADTARQTDPTRPVMFEGDADPAGKADIVNLHYPHELPHWALWPETAYWFDTRATLDNYPGTAWQWDRKKPLYLGAFGRVPAGDAHAASILLGDAAYPDADSAASQADALTWEPQIIAARDAGVNGITPWTMWESAAFPSPLTEAQTRAFRPIGAYLREAGTDAFAGTVVDRTIAVFNDTGTLRNLDLHWRLTPADRRWDLADDVQVSVPPAGRRRVQVRIAVPALAADVTPATLTLEIWDSGQRVFTSSREWKLYGRAALSGPVPGAPSQVAVFDSVGETTERLTELGIKCLPLDEKNAVRVLHFVSVAVVGKGALADASESDLQDEMQSFVRAGGTTIVFEQGVPSWGSDHGSTIAFPRFQGHAVLNGVEPVDLAHWLPDGLVGKRELAKESLVGWLPIVDSGSDRGLATTGLTEMRDGDGRSVFCQLDLTAKIGVDPTATRLFRNLLAYAATRPAPAARTGAFASDAQASTLDAVGLQYDRLTWPLPKSALRKYDTLLICDLEAGISEPARLQQFVQEGGRVLLHNVTPNTVDLARRLTNQPLLSVPLEDGRVTLDDPTGPAAALSADDLAWYTPASPSGSATPALTTDIAHFALRQTSDITTPLQPISEVPTYHTVPGILISSRLGRGLWTIDQVNWDNPGIHEANARRYLATVLTNLGCTAK